MKYYRFFFAVFFIEIPLKFSDFVNSDDCIWKITSNYIWLYIYIQFILNFSFKIKKIRFFPSEKVRNSGNCIYDYSRNTHLRRPRWGASGTQLGNRRRRRRWIIIEEKTKNWGAMDAPYLGRRVRPSRGVSSRRLRLR